MPIGQVISPQKPSQEYITLSQAATRCPYSQEYLSLRARQGKLKAAKIGCKWFTTSEWLQEYAEKTEVYKKHVFEARLQTPSNPPTNLPIFVSEIDAAEDPTPEEMEQRKTFQRKAGFAIAFAMVLLAANFGMFQGRQEVARVAEYVSPAVIQATDKVEYELIGVGFETGEQIEATLNSFARQFYAGGVGEIARGYFGWLKNLLFQDRFVVNDKSTPPPPAAPGSPQNDTGLVVVPSGQDTAQLLSQVKQSFSDEVKVTPYDEESGIITPVFRHRTGEDYLYILVPLQESE